MRNLNVFENKNNYLKSKGLKMRVFTNLIEKTLKTMEIFLMVLMSIMVLAVVWQVFTRFVMNSPSTFTDELSRYLMIWVGIFGGAYTFAIKRHLALEMLMPKLNTKNQYWLQIFINILVILFSYTVLVYGGTSIVNATLGYNQISPSLTFFGNEIPVGYIYLVSPIAGGFIILFGIYDITKLFQSITSINKG